MLSCAIVDDDDVFLALMKQFVDQHSELSLSGSYSNLSDAVSATNENKVDLMLLDIEMPGTSGLQFVKSPVGASQVIFITAHTQYAADAYNYDVTDYIVKPITKERFEKAITKAINISKLDKLKIEHDYLHFKNGQKSIRLLHKDIICAEAYGDYIRLYEGDKVHLLSSTLNNMQSLLGDTLYMRIHRKFIVKIDSIISLSGHNLELSNQKTVQVSRSLKPELVKRMNLTRT